MKPDPRPSGRLRAPARVRPFHILLVEPEIPPNTGNIARLCAATCCPLHLIGPLGFRVDEHAVRRAGLDYWHLVDVRQHATLPAAEAYIAELEPDALEPDASRGSPGIPQVRPAQTWLFSGKATRSYLEVAYRPGDRLVFGKESTGLDEALLEARKGAVLGIPTLGGVRSLNLANAVAIAVFEALRQVGALTPER